MAYQPIPQFVEGAAGSTGTDKLVPILGRRNDANATRADVDGDYGSITIDSAGRVRLGASAEVIGHVVVDSGAITITPSGTQDVNIKNYNGTAVGATNAVHVQPGTGAVFQVQSNSANLATETTLAAAAASLSVLDDWDDGDRAKVSLIAGQAGVEGNSGVVTALTQRVVLATDVALPAGTNAIGKLATNSGVVIGAVEIAAGQTIAVTLAAGAAAIGKAEDTASANSDVGVPSMAIRKATPANTSDTDGDYEMLQMSGGRLWASATIDAALPAGSNVIGHVIIDSGSTTVVTGTVTVAGAKTNNNAAPGATNVGALVALANAAAPTWTEGNEVLLSVDLAGNTRVLLAAETTKVIGTVRNVGNVGAVFDGVNTAATAPANGILGLGIFNTTEPSPTTGQSVGIQLDSKGRQRMVIMDAAGNTRGVNVDANNNMGVVLAAETTKVLGTVRNLGNAGAIFDGVNTAATAPANGLLGLGIFNTTEPSPTTGQSVGIQLDSKGRQRMVLMDAAGNTRGANIDANNNLGVVLAAETTKVLGTIRNVGNVGAVFDGVNTAATAPANGILGLGIFNTTEPSPTTGQSVGIQLDSKGRQRIVLMDAAGNTRGANVNASNQLSVTVDNTPTVTITPGTSGGWLTFMATSADGSTALTNSAQAIKASAGKLGGWYIYNPNSTAMYVHVYNTAAASVTVGTTNPKNTFVIPATAGANVEFSQGIDYDTAMSCAATTTGSGNTAPGTALEANFFYK